MGRMKRGSEKFDDYLYPGHITVLRPAVNPAHMFPLRRIFEKYFL